MILIEVLESEKSSSIQNAGRLGTDKTVRTTQSDRFSKDASDLPAPRSTKRYCINNGSAILLDRAGNTANRGQVLVKGELLEARKETETELSDAGEQGQTRGQQPRPERLGFVGSVTSEGIPAAVPDSPFKHLIERAIANPTRGKTTGPKGLAREQDCLSDSPQRLIGLRNEGGTHQSQNQNAEGEANSSEECSCMVIPDCSPSLSAPDQPIQNAGSLSRPYSNDPQNARGFPPTATFVSQAQAPCTRKSPLSRLIDFIIKHSAYSNPELMNTNFGWMRRGH